MDAIAPCSARGIAPRFWRFCPARLAWRAAASHACGECGAAVVREPWATRGRPKARCAADCARRESNPGHKLGGLYDAVPLRAPRALRSSPLLRWAARRRCERAANANALRQRVCLSVLAEGTKRERERERERERGRERKRERERGRDYTDTRAGKRTKLTAPESFQGAPPLPPPEY